MYRIGFSEDIHPIKAGRKLVLGGAEIPSEFGLDGHSDADVVIHAVAESILGALALGDLGTHFPDNDPNTEGISSIVLLKEVVAKMKANGFSVNNIDVQVGAAKPKLAGYIPQMREIIAAELDVSIDQVSVKAMSYNKCGPIGEGKAIKASSIVMLIK